MWTHFCQPKTLVVGYSKTLPPLWPLKIAKCLQKLLKNDFTSKWKFLSNLQKLPKNVGDLGKVKVATGFQKLSKVQKIAQFGHTGYR